MERVVAPARPGDCESATVFLHDVLSAGAIPTLEATMRFAGQRQSVIAHNVANLDTPDFQPLDVSVQGFQKTLADAIDRRRSATGGSRGELMWKETRELRRDAWGELRLHPRTPSGNILFHDRNNRDLERSMQDLAENQAAFRFASDLLRNQIDQIHRAIGERAV